MNDYIEISTRKTWRRFLAWYSMNIECYYYIPSKFSDERINIFNDDDEIVGYKIDVVGESVYMIRKAEYKMWVEGVSVEPLEMF